MTDQSRRKLQISFRVQQTIEIADDCKLTDEQIVKGLCQGEVVQSLPKNNDLVFKVNTYRQVTSHQIVGRIVHIVYADWTRHY